MFSGPGKYFVQTRDTKMNTEAVKGEHHCFFLELFIATWSIISLILITFCLLFSISVTWCPVGRQTNIFVWDENCCRWGNIRLKVDWNIVTSPSDPKSQTSLQCKTFFAMRFPGPYEIVDVEPAESYASNEYGFNWRLHVNINPLVHVATYTVNRIACTRGG